MNNTPLNTLMIETLRRVTAGFPDLQAQFGAYLEMREKKEERDETGKLTGAARKAREFLRNALLMQMPVKRARRQYEKAVRKRKAKAQEAAVEALLSFVEWDQYQIELDILNEDNPAVEKDVAPSRERPDQDKLDAMARPFVEGLIERGIAPSAIGRLSDLYKDLFAKLIIDLRDDPDFKNAENLWLRMGRAGLLDGYAGAMTAEEAAAVDYAKNTCKDDGAAIEFARKAREECGLPAGFSTGFLEGIYHLRNTLGTVSEGQARAYARASRLVADRDIDLLGQLLKLSDQSDLVRLQALVHFLNQRGDYEVHDTAMTIQLITVRKEFERLEAHRRSTDDWARDVPKMVAALAQDFAHSVPGTEAFEMLLASGFRLSSTYNEVVRLAEIRTEEERRDLFLDEIRWACSQERTFKIVDQSVHLDWDDNFEEIDAKVWDQASWEAEHGALFELSDTEDAGAELTPEDGSRGSPAFVNLKTETSQVETGTMIEAEIEEDQHKDLDDEENCAARTSNLPAAQPMSSLGSWSLFDFEAEEKRASDRVSQDSADRSPLGQKPRPIARKTIDQLTDEDFR